jgi:hypothetical protein
VNARLPGPGLFIFIFIFIRSRRVSRLCHNGVSGDEDEDEDEEKEEDLHSARPALRSAAIPH